tara:strand:- start:315 stop:1070 length:756 start_codon:yes stop_codon:yes gene_type:complete
MAHFYDCNDTLDSFLLEDVTTVAQARKVRAAYPSVTTILSICKDEFLDGIYKPSKMVELGRENPYLHWREVERLCYGLRQHPADGSAIPSSEFGTSVHKRIEELVQAKLHGHDIGESPYQEWAAPFLEWIEVCGVKPIATECVVADRLLKIAGSVDFIGYDSEGKLFLADYKCRTNTKGKAKVYDKDCEQLAIEAFIVQRQHGLEYTPECRSVIIDCETKKHWHHVWNAKDVKAGIVNAKLMAKLFWNKRM